MQKLDLRQYQYSWQVIRARFGIVPMIQLLFATQLLP